MTRNNRNAGNSYERTIRKEYEQWFENPLTTRNASRVKDAGKVDIIGIEPFEAQVKYTKNYPDFYNLLDTMAVGKNIAIVHHKKNIGKGNKTEEVVVIKKSDWYSLLDKLVNNI